MKTKKIIISDLKAPDLWSDLAGSLGIRDDEFYKTFEYGDYAKIELDVDEKLNIVGGRFIPCEIKTS